MMYFLDTNILIYYLKNQPTHITERIDAIPASEVLAMSFFSYAELMMGAYRSTRKHEVEKQLAQLQTIIPVYYPRNDDICRHYAEQFNALKSAGTPIGANDLWIACHALAESAILVTHNTREFDRVQGLRVEDWV